MNVTVIFDIPEQRIADLMVTAIECNDMTSSWCGGVYWKSKDYSGDCPMGHDRQVWYSLPETYEGDFTIDIREWDEDGNERSHIVNRESFEKAFGEMARRLPSHFADFMADNEDADTADVFLQLLALGEVIYG
jgi:hypothetical protein